MDALSGTALYENLDELRKVMSNILAKKPELSSWTRDDSPGTAPRTPRDPNFKIEKPLDATSQVKERKKLQEVLKAYGGDAHQAAMTLGLPRSEILRKMMVYGLR